MMKFVLLASLVVCIQASTTTITTTITTSASGETTVTTSTSTDGAASAAAPSASTSKVPTAAEIALVRETAPLIKTNGEIHTRIFIDHFKYHPEIQNLMPQFANIPLVELAKNAAFKQRAFSYCAIALNFIVTNLDNPEKLSSHLQRIDKDGFYVDYIDRPRQLEETVRIMIEVFADVLGDKISTAALAAWKKSLSYAFSFMGGEIAKVSGSSALSAEELAAVRSAHALFKDNVQVAENCLIKHFVVHPPIQKLYAAFADVPISELPSNENFQAQAHVALRILNFLVENLDNDELLKSSLSVMNSPGFYVDYMDPIYQLDETTRLLLESIKEVVGSAFTAEAAAAFKKGLDHISDIMASYTKSAYNGKALDSTVKRPDCGALSASTKATIRDTWSLARRNADIAPKLFLKMFAAHPETQKMFPRWANVPVAELRSNKFFQQQVYNCLFGLTVIIKNIDTPDIIATLLKNMASTGWYVDGPSSAAQLDETTRLFHEVMAEELGSAYPAEAKAAFDALLNFVHDILVKADAETVPTAEDKQIMKDNMNILKDSNIGAKILLKMVKAHPESQKLLGNAANVPADQLATNAEFQAIGNMVGAGLNFMVNNIDDTTLMRQLINAKDAKKWFMPGVSIRMQMEETFRIALEAVGEELSERFGSFTPKTKAAFKRGFRYLNQVQDESFNF